MVAIPVTIGAPRLAAGDRWKAAVGGGVLWSGENLGNGFSIDGGVRAELTLVSADRAQLGAMVLLDGGPDRISDGFGWGTHAEGQTGLVITGCARRAEGPCLVLDGTVGFEDRGSAARFLAAADAALDAGGDRWRLRLGIGLRRVADEDRTGWGESAAITLMRRFR